MRLPSVQRVAVLGIFANVTIALITMSLSAMSVFSFRSLFSCKTEPIMATPAIHPELSDRHQLSYFKIDDMKVAMWINGTVFKKRSSIGIGISVKKTDVPQLKRENVNVSILSLLRGGKIDEMIQWSEFIPDPVDPDNAVSILYLSLKKFPPKDLVAGGHRITIQFSNVSMCDPLVCSFDFIMLDLY